VRYEEANPSTPLNVTTDRVRNKLNEYLFGMEDQVMSTRDEDVIRAGEVFGVEGLIERGIENE